MKTFNGLESNRQFNITHWVTFLSEAINDCTPHGFLQFTTHSKIKKTVKSRQNGYFLLKI